MRTLAFQASLLFIAWQVGAALAVAQECAPVMVSRASARVEYDAIAAEAGRSGAMLFEPSDSGELRARDEATGAVRWTFRPPELAAASIPNDLMTGLAVLRFDANNDGVIDAGGGDKVWLYFGLKRGGRVYYALDVTRRTPRVLWKAGAAELEGLGEAWSTPTVARVRISGEQQNGEQFVVIVGGGYDPNSSAIGSRLLMLDAATGRLLWSAGNHVGTDRAHVRMAHAFAGRVVALDTDSDRFADRLYAADVGGQIWRFDIWNGRERAGLVTGGVLASLGAAEPRPSPVAPADARRFFNAPDVALIQPRGGDAFYNIAIGSGDGGNAAATVMNDRFYSIRDREPFTKRLQSAYNAAQPLFDADLIDITDNPQEARVPDYSPGWKLDLISSGRNSGEKVLAEALTVNGVILFTTYQPAGCGTNRVYAVRAESGGAALDLNRDQRVSPEDRSMALTQAGVAGEPRIELGPALPRDAQLPPPGEPGDSVPGEQAGGTRCFVGAELMSWCVPLGTVVRTFWKRTSVN